MKDERCVDIYDTTVKLWDTYQGHRAEDRVDKDAELMRTFKALQHFLKRRGWKVTVDARIEQHYRSISKWHRSATKGDLQAALHLAGRTIEFDIWQDVHGVTHPSGGRYESNKRRLLPPSLRLLVDVEVKLAAEWFHIRTGFPITDRRYIGETADQLLAREYATSWHTVPQLGRPRYTNGDRDRTSASGTLLEHGESVVWCYDYSGRLVRGVAFYNINNMWWVRTGKFGLLNKANFELMTVPPSDLRAKSPKRRTAALRRMLEAAVKTEDYLTAHKFKTLLGMGAGKAAA